MQVIKDSWRKYGIAVPIEYRCWLKDVLKQYVWYNLNSDSTRTLTNTYINLRKDVFCKKIRLIFVRSIIFCWYCHSYRAKIDCLLIDKYSFGQFCPLLDVLKSDKIIQNIFVKNNKDRNIVRYLDKSQVWHLGKNDW